MNRIRRRGAPVGVACVAVAVLTCLPSHESRADIAPFPTPQAAAAWQAKFRGRSRQNLGSILPGFGVGNLPDAPLVGNYRAVCLLVRFESDADNDISHTVQYYRNLFQGANNPNSLQKYFLEQSYGQFNLTVDVFGWLTPRDAQNQFLPKASLTPDFTGYGSATAVTTDMVAAAVEQADPTVDFSVYDVDGNGIVDFFILLHASPDSMTADQAAWTQYGGPWVSGYSFANAGNAAAPQSLATGDSVAIDTVLQIDESQMNNIGTIAHEFGHTIGLPDLYDTTSGRTLSAGPIGIWSVMGQGSTQDFTPDPAAYTWNGFNVNAVGFPGVPMHLDPWSKMQLGWLTPTTVAPGQQSVAMPSVETSPTVYRLYANGDPGSNEYFLVERRAKVGFDAASPGEGLLIWHVDTAVIRAGFALNDIVSNLTHLGLAVVQADGLRDLEQAVPTFQFLAPIVFTSGNYGDAGDLWPGTANNLRFVPSTDPTPSTVPNSPNSDDYLANPTGLSITDIVNVANATTATLTVSASFQPTVDILTPAANEQVVNFTPTIQIQFAEAHPVPPGFDVSSMRVLIDGTEVVSSALGNVAFDPGTGLLTYASAALVSGTHTVRAEGSDLGGNVAQGEDLVGAAAPYDEIRFTISPKRLSAGIQMLSVPLTLSHATPSFVLSNPMPEFARWDTTMAPSGGYHEFKREPTNPFVNAMAPGRSYWAKLDTDAALQLRGSDVPRVRQELTFESPNADGTLVAGWYQIACPWDFTIDFNALQVWYQGQTYALQQAVDAGLIGPALYNYRSGGYTFSVAPNGQLESFTGYWIRVLKSGARLFALPLQSGRAAGRAAGGKPSQGEGWLVQLSASAPSGRDESNYLGVSTRAADGRGRLDAEEPPAPVGGGPVRLGFLSPAEPGLYAQDVRRGPLTTTSTWEVLLEGRPGERTTVSWGDLASVPTSVRLMLTDAESGRPLYMRTTRAHTVALGDTGTRRLRVTATPNADSFLRVSNVRIVPTRGGGVTVAFHLSDEATTQVAIRSASGRTMRLLPAVPTRAGVVTRQWDGRDAAGRAAPKGMYVCEIVARSEENRIAKSVHPFAMAR